jgi:hypothetical protein
MSHKEWLIKLVAKDCSLRRLLMLLSHQFDKPVWFQKNSIEFSGFGKFVFNLPRAIKRMDKFDAQLVLYKECLQVKL